MAAIDRENKRRSHGDTLAVTEDKALAIYPVTSQDSANEVLTKNVELNQDQVKNNLVGMIEDQTKTADLESGFANHVPTMEQSGAVQSQTRQQQPHLSSLDFAPATNVDYFASQLPKGLPPTDSAASGSPGLGSVATSRHSSIPASPESLPVSRRDIPDQSRTDFTSNSATPRPTSVPDFQSKSLSRRRDGPDYPKYPDQSFKALQDEQFPPHPRPSSPRPLRTRSSHVSQTSSFTPNITQGSADLPRVPSGAKTAGNTPAQSPGLFSPTSSTKRQWPGEMDEGRSNTPMLHPTHHKPPKE